MKHHYNIKGMTCSGCAKIVHNSLLKVPGVKTVKVDLPNKQASVEMDCEIPVDAFQFALTDSIYEISESEVFSTLKHDALSPDELSLKNKEIVSGYISAVGHLDYEKLHQYLHPDFKFNGALRFDSSGDYIEMIKDHARSPVADILVKNDVKAIFVDENECCVIYDSVTRFPEFTVPFVERIKIEDSKIVSTDVKFNRNRMKQLMQKMSNAKSSI
jgi:copper chaperone CopZ